MDSELRALQRQLRISDDPILRAKLLRLEAAANEYKVGQPVKVQNMILYVQDVLGTESCLLTTTHLGAFITWPSRSNEHPTQSDFLKALKRIFIQSPGIGELEALRRIGLDNCLHHYPGMFRTLHGRPYVTRDLLPLKVLNREPVRCARYSAKFKPNLFSFKGILVGRREAAQRLRNGERYEAKYHAALNQSRIQLI